MCLCEYYKTYYTQLREGLKRSKVNISENMDEVRLCVCLCECYKTYYTQLREGLKKRFVCVFV